jgi:preprotein translocase subunit Sss1
MHDLGLALLIIGIIPYVVELIVRLATLIEEHPEP